MKLLVVFVASLVLITACHPKRPPTPTLSQEESAAYGAPGTTQLELEFDLFAQNASNPKACKFIYAHAYPKTETTRVLFEHSVANRVWEVEKKNRYFYAKCLREEKIFRSIPLPPGDYMVAVIVQQNTPNTFSAGYTLFPCMVYYKDVTVTGDSVVKIDMDEGVNELDLRYCDYAQGFFS